MVLIVQCVNLDIMAQPVLNVFAQYMVCVTMVQMELELVLVNLAGVDQFVMYLSALHRVFMEHALHQISALVKLVGLEHFVMCLFVIQLV